MARFEKHCQDCIKELGKDYAEIHLWLDEFAKKYPVAQYGVYHRGFRHNKDGVELVRAAWGDKAARAAEIHILEDMGYIENWQKQKKIFD
jgi:hypothetical protein